MSVEGLAVRLPEPGVLRRWARSLAVLDAVMSPEWEYRYFSYDAGWGTGEQLASMRNGSGDEWSATFTGAGTYLRGYDHESELNPLGRQPPGVAPGLLAGLPGALREAADEPAFMLEDVPLVTLALWRCPGEGYWSFGDAASGPAGDDGGTWLFEQLDGRPETYRSFAVDYYERDVDLEAVRRVFAGEGLSAGLVAALNPEVTLPEMADEVAAMGHPLG